MRKREGGSEIIQEQFKTVSNRTLSFYMSNSSKKGESNMGFWKCYSPLATGLSKEWNPSPNILYALVLSTE